MKKYDICAAHGEYEKDGQTKVNWKNHGAVFETDGKLSMKLDSLPVGKDFEGWFKLFVPKPKQGEKQQAQSAPSGGYGDRGYDQDDDRF